jgi:hypothetical protein
MFYGIIYLSLEALKELRTQVKVLSKLFFFWNKN